MTRVNSMVRNLIASAMIRSSSSPTVDPELASQSGHGAMQGIAETLALTSDAAQRSGTIGPCGKARLDELPEPAQFRYTRFSVQLRLE